MACFWHHVLDRLDQAVPWPLTLWAYYLGHLGKYVPGKALVVVLRISAIRREISSTWLAVVSTFLETPLMMAVGAALGGACTVALVQSQPLLTALAAAMAFASFAPTLPPIGADWPAGVSNDFARASQLAENCSSEGALDEAVGRITWGFWLSGCLAAAVCWSLLGLSLWATLRGVGVDTLSPLADCAAVGRRRVACRGRGLSLVVAGWNRGSGRPDHATARSPLRGSGCARRGRAFAGDLARVGTRRLWYPIFSGTPCAATPALGRKVTAGCHIRRDIVRVPDFRTGGEYPHAFGCHPSTRRSTQPAAIGSRAQVHGEQQLLRFANRHCG